MTSRAERIVAPPSWGAEGSTRRAVRLEVARARPAAHLGAPGSVWTDAAGPLLVLAATLGLWAAFLAGVWR